MSSALDVRILRLMRFHLQKQDLFTIEIMLPAVDVVLLQEHTNCSHMTFHISPVRCFVASFFSSANCPFDINALGFVKDLPCPDLPRMSTAQPCRAIVVPDTIPDLTLSFLTATAQPAAYR